MTGPNNRVETAETEAAEWHSRLGARSVTTQTVKEFFDWRKSPENADAYRRVQLVWGQSRKLSDNPAMQDAMEAALSRRTEARPRAPRLILALSAAIVLGVTGVGGLLWLQARTVFATTVGEQRVVQLADGSSVRLDTGSRIRVRFTGGRRLIDLESGQALFNVAHDPSRPFVVQAGEASVTAVGTVFDVQREGAGASVTLVSGIVDIASSKGQLPTQRMQAGHQARVTASGAVTKAVDTDTETSWTEGRIVFRDTPLRDAVAEVNRYLTVKIELDAAQLAAEPVNGVFKTGDRDAFVSTAAEVFGLRASTLADGSIRLSERGK